MGFRWQQRDKKNIMGENDFELKFEEGAGVFYADRWECALGRRNHAGRHGGMKSPSNST